MNSLQKRLRSFGIPDIQVVFFLSALLLGVVFRLSFPTDIEFKYDEAWTFDRTQKVGISEPWPMLGMRSGIGTHNAPLSVWIFVVPVRLMGLETPVSVSRMVAVCGVLSLGLLVFFALRVVSRSERMTWLWAMAFAAVNPFVVLLERKIWAQSLFPFLGGLLLLGWWYRSHAWGSLVWGFLGACLGQIQMAGYFWAFSLLLWTVLFSRRPPVRRATAWGFWFLGSGIGAMPMLPWLPYFFSGQDRSTTFAPNLNWFDPFARYWLTDAMGGGLDYTFKLRNLLQAFRAPEVAGHPTYFIGLLYCSVLAIGLGLVLAWSLRTVGSFWHASSTQRARQAVALLLGTESPTRFLLSAALVGFGLLMTVPGFPLYRHYLMVVHPFPWIWAALLLASRPRLRAWVWGAQAVMTAFLLLYVRANGGIATGDYGVSYRVQQEQGLKVQR